MEQITWYQWLGILGFLSWLLGRTLIRKNASNAIKKARPVNRERVVIPKIRSVRSAQEEKMVIPKAKPRTDYLADTRKLTAACFGDRNKADRLIEFEKMKAPGINHAEAVKRALERLDRDRGGRSGR
ncbi:hypothetical protein [Glaciimonas sp. PCH181]|uniref:hypothetical protein n=1 Tax=Glaciimonas sp. PCH181 TaxID=2133943 RepID=UPI0011B28755|nr:hypothetical protein [Glaciimonas sp. PCH181]